MLFVIQMAPVCWLEPNDSTDPAFGMALREAAAQGVAVLAVSAYLGAIAWNLRGLGGWYLHIALPVILWLGAELLTVMIFIRRGGIFCPPQPF